MSVIEATKPDVVKFACLAAGWEFLESRQRNDFSQFGEDGLIEAVFERIGTTNQWCFEVGAADGLFYSNTKRLRDAGWRAVLIEADTIAFDKCRSFESHKVQVVQKKIKHDTLDNLLAGLGAPPRIDFGVIDIDGQDYWAWDGLKTTRPRVMLVEFMYLTETFTDPSYVPTLDGEGQAGLEAIVALGLTKGYTPLAHTYCNVLFVDSTCL